MRSCSLLIRLAERISCFGDWLNDMNNNPETDDTCLLREEISNGFHVYCTDVATRTDSRSDTAVTAVR